MHESRTCCTLTKRTALITKRGKGLAMNTRNVRFDIQNVRFDRRNKQRTVCVNCSTSRTKRHTKRDKISQETCIGCILTKRTALITKRGTNRTNITYVWC